MKKITGKIVLFSSVLLGSNMFTYARQKPNIILIMTDDQGYQDLGCYNSPLIKTPYIDQMAKEGMKLTDYYVSASVSSASRAGLMTGRLNSHNKVTGVLWPDDEGLPVEEVTIAEALKKCGYATACFGKWHLGDRKGHLPTDQGFDSYYGVPYSNDMYIGAYQEIADHAVFREGYDLHKVKDAQNFVKTHERKQITKSPLKNLSPLLEQDQIVEYPCDQSTLTNRYFNKAIDFINQSGDQPFFIYLTPNMPHVPLHASEKFEGKSARGLYGDVVEEVDWNVGRLIEFIDKKGLSENTLIIFTSDNGPWLAWKDQGGSALPLRDGKFSHYEGGVRTPCIIRWKGHVPAGITSDAMFASIDWFPTFLHLAGNRGKSYTNLDGMDLSSFLKNPQLRLRDEYVYVKNGKVHGVRKGNWIYLPNSGQAKTMKNIQPELFNIKLDLPEKNNLHLEYPEKVKELKNLMHKYE